MTELLRPLAGTRWNAALIVVVVVSAEIFLLKPTKEKRDSFMAAIYKDRDAKLDVSLLHPLSHPLIISQ